MNQNAPITANTARMITPPTIHPRCGLLSSEAGAC